MAQYKFSTELRNGFKAVIEYTTYEDEVEDFFVFSEKTGEDVTDLILYDKAWDEALNKAKNDLVFKR